MVQEINHNQASENGTKKRILFVITQSEFGGAQRFLHTLLEHLPSERYETLVAVGQTDDNNHTSDNFLTSIGKIADRVIQLKHMVREVSPAEDLMAWNELRHLIKQERPDVLFSLSSKAGFIASLAAAKPSRVKHLKVIYRIGGWTFNDPWPAWQKRLWIFLEKLSAQWKDIIIVNNLHDLEQAQKLHITPRQDLKLIYNGIDALKLVFLPREQAQTELEKKLRKQIFNTKHTIVSVANFYPTKGLTYLIEAAKLLKQKTTDWRLLLIGDGEQRQLLEQLIADYGLTNQVLLAGQLNDASRYLPAFDLLVLPSVKEGFPWAILEAMAAKIPVVATAVGAVPEILEDGQNGLVVPPGQPEPLATALERMMTDDSATSQMTINAHQRVLFKFSVEKMVKDITALL